MAWCARFAARFWPPTWVEFVPDARQSLSSMHHFAQVSSQDTLANLGGTQYCNRAMQEPFTRDRIIEALQAMPPNATIDDAIERLLFLAKIGTGLAELDRSEGVPHDKAGLKPALDTRRRHNGRDSSTAPRPAARLRSE